MRKPAHNRLLIKCHRDMHFILKVNSVVALWTVKMFEFFLDALRARLI